MKNLVSECFPVAEREQRLRMSINFGEWKNSALRCSLTVLARVVVISPNSSVHYIRPSMIAVDFRTEPDSNWSGIKEDECGTVIEDSDEDRNSEAVEDCEAIR